MFFGWAISHSCAACTVPSMLDLRLSRILYSICLLTSVHITVMVTQNLRHQQHPSALYRIFPPTCVLSFGSYGCHHTELSFFVSHQLSHPLIVKIELKIVVLLWSTCPWSRCVKFFTALSLLKR